jgi:hypothetical protein
MATTGHSFFERIGEGWINGKSIPIFSEGLWRRKMGEARNRRLWEEAKKKMGDLKIMGLDGKPIPPPSKENPVVPAIPPEVSFDVIAQIEASGTGQYGIRVLRQIPIFDLCEVLAKIIGGLIEKNKANYRLVGPDGNTPVGTGQPG